MTSEEINQLRRDALLALKAYFSCSLDKDTAELLSLPQIAAAQAMHEAGCREILRDEVVTVPHGLREALLAMLNDAQNIAVQNQADRWKLDRLIRRLKRTLKLIFKYGGGDQADEAEEVGE